MATPLCDIDGSRPAVATVRIRENGRVVTRNLCEIHLAEVRAGRLGLGDGGSGGGRSLFDEFFSDFFDRPFGADTGARPPGVRTAAPAARRPVEQVDITRLLLGRDARAPSARGAACARVGLPRP